MRRGDRLALLSVVLLVGVAVLNPLSVIYHEPTEEKTAANVQLVKPAENSSTVLWPYTSRGRSFETVTLPINVVVHADSTTVRRLLTSDEGSDAGFYWNESASGWRAGTPESANVTIDGTNVEWGESEGSVRYTYIQTPDGNLWIRPVYQLHDGTYFGSRYHLRIYDAGPINDRWTSIQAHHEYWDWFQLRHRVDSLGSAQHYVERDLRGTRLLSAVSRERYGNGGVLDADGWVTVVDFRTPRTYEPEHSTRTDSRPVPPIVQLASAVGLLFVALIGDAVASEFENLVDWTRERRDLAWEMRYHLALFASTALIPLVVRIGAIGAEQTFPNASPVVIGGPFYVMLVVGLPAVAAVFGGFLPADEGFTTATLGMGAGIMLDYMSLGIAAIPFGAVVQRLVLLFGLGLIAAGGVRGAETPVDRNRYRIAGLVIWVGALVWPLIG